jgi:hypothetical protein
LIASVVIFIVVDSTDRLSNLTFDAFDRLSDLTFDDPFSPFDDSNDVKRGGECKTTRSLKTTCFKGLRRVDEFDEFGLRRVDEVGRLVVVVVDDDAAGAGDEDLERSNLNYRTSKTCKT